jgi:serine phosphatase RsbU (regulator of sigma subunit)
MPSVLLSAADPPADLRELLTSAGLAVVDHVLGAIPPLDFAEIAVAFVDVADRPDGAAAQTRRWRAELGDDLLPIIWLLPTADSRLAARGLDSGADAILARPLEAALVLAQVRSAARVRSCALRLTARAHESRLLGEHLKKAHAEAARGAAAIRRVRLAFLERSFPEYGAVRVFVSHRPRGRFGGDFHEVIRIGDDRIALVVGDVLGPGAAGGLIGHLVARIAGRLAGQPASSAGSVLAGVNRELLALGLDDLPLVAMLICIVDYATGQLELARAGLPPPLYLPCIGTHERWPIPGPFLGSGDTAFATHRATLLPGDRIVIGTDGIRPDGSPEPTDRDHLLECAEQRRDRSGQSFTDAVASDLLAEVRHEDDFTLLVLERER